MHRQELDPVRPSANDTLLAQETSRRLANLRNENADVKVKILGQEGYEDAVVIPSAAMRLLLRVLAEMGDGNAIALTPIHTELTTQQAADLLNVSRPYVVQLLENGKIPFHRVGTHRRVLFEDVMQYKNNLKEKRRKVLAELSAEAQELGLGY